MYGPLINEGWIRKLAVIWRLSITAVNLPLTLSCLTCTIKRLKFINERFNVGPISMRRKKYAMEIKYTDRDNIPVYIYHVYTTKKWKHHTELNVFRINKIDTWVSFWTLNKSRHLPKVLLLTLKSHCQLRSVSDNHFAGNLTKIFFSWFLLLFQKTRYGLSAVCFFNNYFKKGILQKVDLPTYKTPSELLQGEAWTSSGIVNGNFCKEEQKSVNVFFKPIKVAQENIDFSFHQELIFQKGKYGASIQQWTK